MPTRRTRAPWRLRLSSLLPALPYLLALTCLAPPSRADDSRDASERAWTYFLRGRPADAVVAAEDALSRPGNGARAAVCLVDGLQRLGRIGEAPGRLEPFEEEHPGVKRLGAACVAYHRNRIEATAAELRALTDAAVEAGDERTELVGRHRLAMALQRGQQHQAALTAYRETLDLANALADTLTMIHAHFGIAWALQPTSDFEQARKHATEALESATRRDLPLWVGDAESLLAALCWFDLRVDEIAPRLERACDAYDRAGDLARHASALRRLGATHGGNYVLAIQRLRRAREMAFEAGDLGEASFCLEHIGSMHNALGDIARAREEWAQALEEGKDHWPPSWRQAALSNLGVAAFEAGDTDLAREYFERGLADVRESGNELELPGALVRLALYHHETGSAEKGLVLAEEAAALAHELRSVIYEFYAWLTVGRARADLDDLAGARSAIGAARDLVGDADLPDWKLHLLDGEAYVARRADDPETAWHSLRESMEIVERMRDGAGRSSAVQHGVFQKKAEFFEGAVQSLFDLHRRHPTRGLDRESYHVAQRVKARAFLDLLAEASIDLRFRADPAYRDREQQLLDRLAELGSAEERAETRAEVVRLEDELKIHESKLRDADPRYANVLYPQPAAVGPVQATLSEGEMLLEYLVGPEASHVWAVTSDGLRLERIPPRADLERMIEAVLPLLADYNLTGPDPGYLVPALRELSRALLGPIANDVEGMRAVVVAPHDVLHLVPFEALLLSDSVDAGSYVDLPWLVSGVDVSYVPSGTMRVHEAESAVAEAGPGLLAIGDPQLLPGAAGNTHYRSATGREPKPLPFAATEIEGIARHFRTSDVVMLRGERARRSDIEVAGNQFRLVHFATHGIYNQQRPRFSGLILSADADRDDDGFLALDEVFSLDLRCDQVVLSACHSALGQRLGGEGVVGLTRGFLYAGARSVVAAHWAVAGEATAWFMDTFYGAIAAHADADRRHALSEAKRSFLMHEGAATIGARRVDLAHPYFWAGFTLTGVSGA